MFIESILNGTDTGFQNLPEFSKKYIDVQTVHGNPYISQHQIWGFCQAWCTLSDFVALVLFISQNTESYPVPLGLTIRLILKLIPRPLSFQLLQQESRKKRRDQGNERQILTIKPIYSRQWQKGGFPASKISHTSPTPLGYWAHGSTDPKNNGKKGYQKGFSPAVAKTLKVQKIPKLRTKNKAMNE